MQPGANTGGGEALRTACADEMDRVCRIVSRARCDLSIEKQTQADVEWALADMLWPDQISREHRLSGRDIVDFLLFGRVALEVKGPRHSRANTLRQLVRYAGHPRVEGVILATSRAMAMPPALGPRSVPCRVINLGKAWL